VKIFGACSHLCLSVSECGIKSSLKNFGAWWTFWAYALHPRTTLGSKWGKSTGINLFPPSLPLPSLLTPPPLIVRGLGSAVSSPSVVRVLMCDILSTENAFGGDKTAIYRGTKILQNMAKSKFLCSVGNMLRISTYRYDSRQKEVAKEVPVCHIPAHTVPFRALMSSTLERPFQLPADLQWDKFKVLNDS